MIYISGPITNDPDHMDKFLKAEEFLDGMGKTAFNPTRNDFLFPKMKGKYSWYLDLSLVELSWCNEICMLEGWQDSTGAKMEYSFAKIHGYKVYFLKDGKLLEEE